MQAADRSGRTTATTIAPDGLGEASRITDRLARARRSLADGRRDLRGLPAIGRQQGPAHMKQRATLCRVEPVARVKCADMDMSARVAPVAEPKNLIGT